MKNTNRVSAQKYLRRRDSLESSEFSTVIEVNPSCESEESMLEKIIFTGSNQPLNINNCDPKAYKKYVLTERNSNVHELKNNPTFHDKNENIFKHYKSEQYSSQNKRPLLSEREPNENYFGYKSIKYEVQNKNYENQLQSYESLHQASYSTSSLIDEEKLQKIQQKIRNHQMKQNNKENNEIYRDKKRPLHDTMEKELSKIQIYDSEIKMRKKPTIIDKIKDEKIGTTRNQHIDRETVNKFEYEPLIDRFTKNSEKCLETIYDLVLVDQRSKLSPENINLKNSIKEEIKLVLGPIFADVTIKGKTISKTEFLDKATEILKTYRDEEIEEIFFSIVNGLSKNFKDYDQFSRNQETKSVELMRVPGRLLKNSKTDCEAKEKENHEYVSRNEMKYFSHFEIPSNFTSRKSVDFKIPQRVSKKVYIEETEKTEPEESYQHSKEKVTHRYDLKANNLHHQTLEIMLNEEKSKRKQVELAKNEENQSIKLSANDDELERLNNLEKKFNEHFRAKGVS